MPQIFWFRLPSDSMKAKIGPRGDLLSRWRELRGIYIQHQRSKQRVEEFAHEKQRERRRRSRNDTAKKKKKKKKKKIRIHISSFFVLPFFLSDRLWESIRADEINPIRSNLNS
eukprot:TRINITY_DN2831_c0_g1_i2.p1 TRINITY_DN2831_c0_g1~~TRINITY_DN2831_c0_g1_i2.p1  ORF type:complete len:113 (-),score=15.58 TRINITY_DN2831_c0_g1_i2:279-617(-)